MNGLATLMLTATALGGLAAGAAQASANMEAGDPGRQPCHFYLHREIPAPKRCLRYYHDAVGPGVYVHGGFVFRSREAFLHARGSIRGEERWAGGDEGRYRDHERDSERDRMADREPPPPPNDREDVSGGPSRGTGTYQGESGGASRGPHVPEGRSGGASGY
jgi:hypothetical protein